MKTTIAAVGALRREASSVRSPEPSVEREVEHQDVDAEAADQLDGVGAAVGLGDDLEPGLLAADGDRRREPPDRRRRPPPCHRSPTPDRAARARTLLPGSATAARASLTPSPNRDGGPAAMADVEIGIGKSGRRAYGFDDIAIVPSRRTRDPEEVDIGWEIDAFRFELPVMASPADSVVSPATAAELGRLGAVGVLHLEGLWTRYADPEPVLEEIAGLPGREGHQPDAGALRRAGAARPRRAADRRAQGERPHRRGGVHAAAHPQPWRPTCSAPSPTCSSCRAPWCRPSTCPASTSRST